jgi:hypothetical protein
MINKQPCPACMYTVLLAQALEIIPTAHGPYLDFVLDIADACMVLLNQPEMAHRCNQPPYSNTGVNLIIYLRDSPRGASDD